MSWSTPPNSWGPVCQGSAMRQQSGNNGIARCVFRTATKCQLYFFAVFSGNGVHVAWGIFLTAIYKGSVGPDGPGEVLRVNSRIVLYWQRTAITRSAVSHWSWKAGTLCSMSRRLRGEWLRALIVE